MTFLLTRLSVTPNSTVCDTTSRHSQSTFTSLTLAWCHGGCYFLNLTEAVTNWPLFQLTIWCWVVWLKITQCYCTYGGRLHFFFPQNKLSCSKSGHRYPFLTVRLHESLFAFPICSKAKEGLNSPCSFSGREFPNTSLVQPPVPRLSFFYLLNYID